MTTIAEDIKAEVGFDVPDPTINMLLRKRGITGTDESTTDILNSKQYELATADIYKWLITTPTIAESGFQISMTGKLEIRKMVSSIYLKYGEADPFSNEKPNTVTGISPW